MVDMLYAYNFISRPLKFQIYMNEDGEGLFLNFSVVSWDMETVESEDFKELSRKKFRFFTFLASLLAP